mmetsp:Transcript_4759/g.9922  ORF Transcript_4759/g.9922 Transcript_4759/m.9922 type:complete len:96 (+) Transcript_4759:531-818(+)
MESSNAQTLRSFKQEEQQRRLTDTVNGGFECTGATTSHDKHQMHKFYHFPRGSAMTFVTVKRGKKILCKSTMERMRITELTSHNSESIGVLRTYY